MARPADPNAREALVTAARAEFARRGLVGARIEDITAACGLSKGAFYLHFESKRPLFGELVERFVSVLAEFSDPGERAMARSFAELGAVRRRDLEDRTPRYPAVLELEPSQ